MAPLVAADTMPTLERPRYGTTIALDDINSIELRDALIGIFLDDTVLHSRNS